MANLLLFGDSIPYGCWDEEGGWAYRLKHAIEKDIIASSFAIDHFVYPLGIPGDTSHTLLQRFKPEADARIVASERTLFVFAIGINDAIFNNRTNSQMIPLWKYKNNLTLLIKQAKRYSHDIFFVGLTPVDETKVDPMPWLPECSYKNEFIKEYDKAIQEICREEHATYIPIFSEWHAQEYQSMLADGIHPNASGHTNLFEQIKKILSPRLL